MSEDSKRRPSLGRGLSALFGEAEIAERRDNEPHSAEAARPPRLIPIEFIQPGRFQPRRKFDAEAIQGLADSIKERGLLQPLLVRRLPGQADRYEVIAGERRWRAAQIAGLHELPVILRDLTDREALEIALVENVQREDLTALEEAEGYQRLINEFGHTQEALAKALGKSRSHVANTLRLLSLPDPLRTLLDQGSLTAGHARALLTAEDPVGLANEVVKRGLNVRQTEQLARTAASGRPPRPPAPPKDADTIALEADLSARLGLKVSIAAQGEGGTVSIRYLTLDQLDEVIHRLQG
ncbi:MAG: ParB/RepB/Spo0J family partition protein [Azospirillaceae bacterium]|nr:ParB/RepB/Spo0J family partition protein [Azospirillaceae bacterium]